MAGKKIGTIAKPSKMSVNSESAAPATVSEPIATKKVISAKSQPSEEEIRTLAYLKWESAGRPESDGVYFWVDAERELCEPKSALPKPHF